MARLHSLMVWSVVLALLATASLCGAETKEAKEPKQKHAKAAAEKSKLHASDNPLAQVKKHSAPAVKMPRPVLKPLRPGENVARIEAALNGPTEVNFVDAPLQEVIDSLKELHEIEIQIDSKALEDVGIGIDSPVTVNLKGITLRSALNLTLRKLSLTWLIKDEVLLITTPEEADLQLTTKVYDVADLVVCRDEHDVVSDDYDSLSDIITSTMKPTSWDGVGGPGSIQGETLGTARVLVVSQTRDVHEEIADLLAKIREVAKKTPNAGLPRHDMSKPASSGLAGSDDTEADSHKDNAKGSAADKTPTEHAKQPAKPETPKGHGGTGKS